MKPSRAPIPDQAEWQALLKAEEDHRRSKVMTGLEQARRGEGMDEAQFREWIEDLKARLATKN